MDKKEMKRKMPIDVLEDVEKARQFNYGKRVGVTALGRSTDWRKELDQLSVMEVVDRTDTVAILVNPETFKSLMDYIDYTEKELEQAQVEAVFGHRLKTTEFYSGDELSQKAKARFNERKAQLRGSLDEFSE